MIQLGKQRFRKKWNVTGEINMPTWWRLPESVRWQHTARNYEKSYDAWTAEFTFDTRKYSGQWLVDYINAENPDAQVLDVGCGSNPYKGKIKNIIGIEPGTWGNGDLRWSLREAVHKLKDGSFDFITAIGPLNHGDTQEIDEMITTMHGLLKPGGKLIALVKPANWGHIDVDPWRENRGLCYPWTKSCIKEFGEMHEFDVVMEPDLDGTDLSTLTDEVLHKLAAIEPWERTLDGNRPYEEEVQDGDMYSQWVAIQNEVNRRQTAPDTPAQIIRQRWFWIWQKPE